MGHPGSANDVMCSTPQAGKPGWVLQGWIPGHPLGCTRERGEQGTFCEVVTSQGDPESAEIDPSSISEMDPGAEFWAEWRVGFHGL